MNTDKLKQYVALFGGWLSAVLLFMGTLNVKFDWFNEESIGAFEVVLMASVPFVIAIYGIYKNSYRLSEKAKKQEQELKRKGLK
ncbi:phage holin [Sporosarcina sp. NPDC096371]|uniref:phage holin n=1 Tax=Sporosarcina sp. NPDC096371 TaxID=3364530 RepID=UPI0037F8ED00